MEGIGIVLGIVAIAAGYWILVMVGAAVTARQRQTVVCPADHEPAVVRCRGVDGVRGMLMGADPRIAACDRWPDRAGCPQGCVAQLTASPTVESLPLARRPPTPEQGATQTVHEHARTAVAREARAMHVR